MKGPRPSPRPTGAGGASRLALAALALTGLAACRTQLWPAPMRSEVVPLPPGKGVDIKPGLEEVVVLRHADPVNVRRSGTGTGFPLSFFRKTERLRAGGWIFCGAGGRAEVLWPADGANAVLFDEGVAVVGEPARGEPALTLEKLTRVHLSLGPGDRIRIPGGAILSGPPLQAAGPYLVEHVYAELLRVSNRAKVPLNVAFRDEVLVLGPGEKVDLPLLGAGGAPIERQELMDEYTAGGVQVAAEGRLEPVEDDRGLRLRASEPATLRGSGVGVRLEAGEEALFSGLGPPGSTPAPTVPARPGPETPGASDDGSAPPPADEGLPAAGEPAVTGTPEAADTDLPEAADTDLPEAADTDLPEAADTDLPEAAAEEPPPTPEPGPDEEGPDGSGGGEPGTP